MLRRVAITGGPRTGKTTAALGLGRELSCRVRHTDDVIDLGWSEASEHVAGWFDRPGSVVVEGVAVPRALRKWLRQQPEGRPVEEVWVFRRPHVPLADGQARMAAGVRTVLEEIRPELERRGVEISWL